MNFRRLIRRRSAPERLHAGQQTAGCPFGLARATQQALHTPVVVQRGPVDAGARAACPPMLQLLERRLCQRWISRQRHAERASILQFHHERLAVEADVFLTFTRMEFTQVASFPMNRWHSGTISAHTLSSKHDRRMTGVYLSGHVCHPLRTTDWSCIRRSQSHQERCRIKKGKVLKCKKRILSYRAHRRAVGGYVGKPTLRST